MMLKELVKKLGPATSSPQGWHNFKCPFCGAPGRFGVHIEKQRTWCFKCESNPNLVMLAKLLGLRRDVRELLSSTQTLGGYWAGVDAVVARKGLGEAQGPISLVDWCRIPSKDAPLISRELLDYATSRHVDPTEIEIGMFDTAELAGYLVFLYRMDGVPVYWQARNVCGAGPKSRNPASGFGFDRGEVLFNFDAIKPGRVIVVCEGPFDAVAVHDPNNDVIGTCLLGKSLLTKHQIKLLKDSGAQHVVACLDGDAPAEQIKLYQQLESAGFRVESAMLPEGQDPSEIGPKKMAQMIANAKTLSRRDQALLRFRGSRKKTGRLKQEKHRSSLRFRPQ